MQCSHLFALIVDTRSVPDVVKTLQVDEEAVEKNAALVQNKPWTPSNVRAGAPVDEPNINASEFAKNATLQTAVTTAEQRRSREEGDTSLAEMRAQTDPSSAVRGGIPQLYPTVRTFCFYAADHERLDFWIIKIPSVWCIEIIICPSLSFLVLQQIK